MFDIGTIKLSDFGLSKSLPVNKHAGYDINATFRLTGETGSYRYMAPEVSQNRLLYQSILYRPKQMREHRLADCPGNHQQCQLCLLGPPYFGLP